MSVCRVVCKHQELVQILVAVSLPTQVLAVGDLHPPLIHYRYTRMADQPLHTYDWVFQGSWSRCSSICEGNGIRENFGVYATLFVVETTSGWGQSGLNSEVVLILK